MAAMSAVVPLAQDVAWPLAVLVAVSVAAVLAAASVTWVLAAVSVAAVLAADSVASVLAAGSVASVLMAASVESVLAAASVESVLAAVLVAAVLVAVFVAAVLVAGSVTMVLVAGSVTAVLVAGSVTAVLVAGSVTAVLVAVSVAVVQVVVLVVVLSAVQVGVNVDVPLTFWLFPTLDGGTAVLPLSTFVLSEPLVAGVFTFSLWDVGNFLTFGGGGMSLPSLRGTLAALLLDALQNPAIAGTTVLGDVLAEVLGWDLERWALGDGRGGGVGKRSTFDRKSFLDTLGRVDGGGLGVEEEVVDVGGVRLLTLGGGAWAGGCCEVDGCWVVLADSVLAILVHRARPLGQVRRWRHPPVYRPLVDLSTMEDRHIIITYRLDHATIPELCAQLEPDLVSAIRHPTVISPLVQVLSVLHFLASGSFQITVAIASGMSQPMFSNVLSRVLSALLKHMRSYIVFPQVEDLPTVKGDFYALGHIPNIIGAIDGTHVALVPPQE
ncbi:hypothetical protein NDU88_004960 [Pleurodeles waltl]|uniref:Nuclease HARBI1 n=1 Tax=Pleurodeles waltl TaxID=8319 RepID=A0AAV7MAQ8_PLEWA|nr:hypothetical protein NDU88_004960 [Pleurodeles waltl]